MYLFSLGACLCFYSRCQMSAQHKISISRPPSLSFIYRKNTTSWNFTLLENLFGKEAGLTWEQWSFRGHWYPWQLFVLPFPTAVLIYLYSTTSEQNLKTPEMQKFIKFEVEWIGGGPQTSFLLSSNPPVPHFFPLYQHSNLVVTKHPSYMAFVYLRH